MEVGLVVNSEWTKHIAVCYHQNEGQNHSLLSVNKSLEMWQSSNTWEQQTKLHSRRN